MSDELITDVKASRFAIFYIYISYTNPTGHRLGDTNKVAQNEKFG